MDCLFPVSSSNPEPPCNSFETCGIYVLVAQQSLATATVVGPWIAIRFDSAPCCEHSWTCHTALLILLSLHLRDDPATHSAPEQPAALLCRASAFGSRYEIYLACFTCSGARARRHLADQWTRERRRAGVHREQAVSSSPSSLTGRFPGGKARPPLRQPWLISPIPMRLAEDGIRSSSSSSKPNAANQVV